MITQTYVNDIAYKIVGCAIEVHKELGPGLLESIYQKCFVKELELKGLKTTQQIKIPVHYKDEYLDCNLRLDVLVEELIIVELKAVEEIHPLYKAQLLTYMKLLEKPKGLLINFNTENITKSLVPMVNEYFSVLPK
jgi:GxxExxY protein